MNRALSRATTHLPLPPQPPASHLAPRLGASPSPRTPTASSAPRRRPFSSTMADSMKRNPHPDFKAVEASRPDWDASKRVRSTKTPSPGWKLGSGANEPAPPGTKHVAIDPYAEGRPSGLNYKLLISAVVPRPIAFISTRSADGSSSNLAPFSYFNVLNHDPPLFVVGFASGAAGSSKDTLRNLEETGECVISIISETYIEAANAASVNAPYSADEWALSGLTPVRDCERVACPRVAEAVWSVEAKVDTVRNYDSRSRPGNRSGTVVIFEGLRFWVREDALNEEQSLVDPAVLRPMSRIGGITYGRLTDTIELPRLDWEKDVGGQEGYDKILKEKESSK